MNTPFRAFRVHRNAFGSVQIDPVDVFAVERITQTATVALGAGWRPRECPFAELASTPAKATALALALLASVTNPPRPTPARNPAEGEQRAHAGALARVKLPGSPSLHPAAAPAEKSAPSMAGAGAAAA
ncbi:MAG TPA: hypothetical protein VK163_01195 [Opitutaceae bacterium]|nr:hypothetical protein [Opitutaceae bacterium]